MADLTIEQENFTAIGVEIDRLGVTLVQMEVGQPHRVVLDLSTLDKLAGLVAQVHAERAEEERQARIDELNTHRAECRKMARELVRQMQQAKEAIEALGGVAL